MKIRLRGDLDSDLIRLGLYPGKVVNATADVTSTVGCMHFRIGSDECSVWPENYTTDMTLVEASMTVYVRHNGYIKQAVVTRILPHPIQPVGVRFIGDWSGFDCVNNSDILDR